MAASHGHLDVLRHLLANGADVNAREGLQGLTVLHYAVQNRDEKMVKYLLSESLRLNPDLRNYRGRNAWQTCPVLPDDIRQYLTTTGIDSPYSSEEDSSDEDDDVEVVTNCSLIFIRIVRSNFSYRCSTVHQVIDSL